MPRSPSFRAAWRAVLCSLLLVVASIALFPAASQALPVPGNYQWDPGQIISGTFTAHSSGGFVPAWNMIIGGITFMTAPLGPTEVEVNGDGLLSQFVNSPGDPLPHNLFILWRDERFFEAASVSFTRNNGQFFTAEDVTFSPVQAVPEPTTLLQLALGLGLLACVGYGMRQRPQAGLQIG